MRTAANWAPLWPLLTAKYRVTAMDRRGRGMSGDGPEYDGEREYDDVAAVARHIGEVGDVNVLAHSIGAVFALGAAGRGAPIRRMLLCEPPGPPTQSREALERRLAWIADGQAGRALVELLVEVMGLDPAMLAAMRDTPRRPSSLAVFTATYEREGEFLQTVDLAALARDVTVPVHFLLGEQSPAWAGEVTRALAARPPRRNGDRGAGHGHDLVNSAPDRSSCHSRASSPDAGLPAGSAQGDLAAVDEQPSARRERRRDAGERLATRGGAARRARRRAPRTRGRTGPRRAPGTKSSAAGLPHAQAAVRDQFRRPRRGLRDRRRRPVDREDVPGRQPLGHRPRGRAGSAADLQHPHVRPERQRVHHRREPGRERHVATLGAARCT